jgi:hypothetical protein
MLLNGTCGATLLITPETFSRISSAEVAKSSTFPNSSKPIILGEALDRVGWCGKHSRYWNNDEREGVDSLILGDSVYKDDYTREDFDAEFLD